LKISKILSGIALLLAISTFAQAETPVQVSINLIAGPNGGWICPDNMSPVFDQDAGFYGLSVINLADSLVCCYGMCGHGHGTRTEYIANTDNYKFAYEYESNGRMNYAYSCNTAANKDCVAPTITYLDRQIVG
jgi:hypothetical protein